MVRTTYDDDDDEDDDHSEVSIDEDIAEDGENGVNTTDDGIAMSFDDLALNEFDNSLNKMSITPKNYRFGSELQGRMRMPSRIRPSTSPESL